MKMVFVFVFAFAFVFVLLTGSLMPAHAAAAGRDLIDTSGYIFAIDQESRMIKLQDCFTWGYCIYTDIYVTEATRILSNRKLPPIAFEDLQVGVWVDVRYYELGGINYAWIISAKT